MKNRVMWRSLFYAATVVLGLLLAYDQLRFPASRFWQVIAVVLVVFVSELAINVHQHRQLFAGRIVETGIGSSRLAKLIDHFILPIAVYVSIAGFVYFNRTTQVVYVVLIGAFVMFTLLFANIRAFYLHYSSMEVSTHYVYDIVKLISFFCATNAVFNLAASMDRGYLILVPLLALVLMGLTTHRYQQLHPFSALLVGLLGLIVGVLSVVLFLSFPGMIMSVGLITFAAFYFSMAFLHHYMHSDLTIRIIVEYLLVFLLVLLLVLGISLPG